MAGAFQANAFQNNAFQIGDAGAVVTPSVTGGVLSGSYDFLNPRRKRREVEEEPELVHKVIKVGPASAPITVQTGVIEKRPNRAPVTDIFSDLIAVQTEMQAAAEERRRKQIRRNNAYLMLM